MILSKNKNIQKIQFLPKTSISEKIDSDIFIIKKKKKIQFYHKTSIWKKIKLFEVFL